MSKRSQEPEDRAARLPGRATGVFLGVWVAALLFIAFFVVPQLFAGCMPQPQ